MAQQQEISIHKKLQELNTQLSKIVDECETSEDLFALRNGFHNMYVNFHTQVENKQTKIEGKMLDELEKLRKIKELLNQ